MIIDIHNYGRYRIDGREYAIDSGRVTTADFVDLWTRLSDEFRSDAGVWAYGLMCEPHDMGSADWKSISQAALAAIRRKGDGLLVLVPGDDWSSAARWVKRHGPSGWIVDPVDNFRYEAHLYFDPDESGGYTGSYDDEFAGVARRRLRPFAEWCRANGVKGYLGEYGVPGADARWIAVLDDLLTALDEEGFDGTYWAAGEWWGDYPLSVQPEGDFERDRPQTAVLLRHLGDSFV